MNRLARFAFIALWLEIANATIGVALAPHFAPLAKAFWSWLLLR